MGGMDEQDAARLPEFIEKVSEPFQIIIVLAMLAFAVASFLIFAGLFGVTTLVFSATGSPAILLEGIVMPCVVFFVTFAILGYCLIRLLIGRNMLVKLEKLSYVFGEQINGTVTINRNMSKQARSLKIIFYGLQRQGKHNRYVCKKETLLSGARTFRKGETIPFLISIPGEVKNYIGANDPLKDNRYLGVALRLTPYIPSWYVEAKLDLPNEVDMSKAVMIRITPVGQPIPPSSSS